MAASSSFGPGVLLDVDGRDRGRAGGAEVGRPAPATTSAAPPPAASAAKVFGRNAARYGPSPVNVVVTSCVATEDRRRDA